MQSGLERVRIVLVRPRGAGNVGAAARAMKNCGAGDLAIVRPRARLAAAERMAVHARDLVRGAQVVDDVATAVADCRMVVGTTSRAGGYRAGAEDLTAVAPALLAQAEAGPVAILFGPEDHGLSNTDLRHCQRLCSIDTSDEYASLNLAQAVLLVCWELRRAARLEAPRPPAVAPAPAAAGAALDDHLQVALLRRGVLQAQSPEQLRLALRGLARQMDGAAAGRGATVEPMIGGGEVAGASLPRSRPAP